MMKNGFIASIARKIWMNRCNIVDVVHADIVQKKKGKHKCVFVGLDQLWLKITALM